jgi:hypothetical protein
LSVRINGFWLSTNWNVSSSDLIILIKSETYFQFIPNSISSPFIIAGIVVVPAHLSVFPDDIITLSVLVFIWMKLLMSLVSIPIFLIAFSQSDLSTMIFVLKFWGIISSLSYSGKLPCISSEVASILVSST